MNIKVLVVEDDPMVSKLHDVYINQLEGFKLVHSSKTTDDAMHYLLSQKVDLVILDVYMPGRDGMALLKDIRMNDLNVDVIMISAASDREKILEAMRLGVFDYIIKPFEFERFSIALGNFKQRFSMTHKEGKINQEDLDCLVFNKTKNTAGKIPKGLEKNTLLKVWTEILEIEGNFTTEEIANRVEISRVSIRKYLDFLRSINVLYLELNRGNVGRPVYKYKCINKNATIVTSYIEK